MAAVSEAGDEEGSYFRATVLAVGVSVRRVPHFSIRRRSQGSSGAVCSCYGDEPHPQVRGPDLPALSSPVCSCKACSERFLLQECLHKPAVRLHCCASQTPESWREAGLASGGVQSGGATPGRRSGKGARRGSCGPGPLPAISGSSFPELGVTISLERYQVGQPQCLSSSYFSP